ncbi:hypothetical protein [Glycocaulis sp.]|uniref:hypothetical protein n=1 Tax=Glycocaulis sp. TaxID=1969725 RepID=UPI003F6F1666
MGMMLAICALIAFLISCGVSALLWKAGVLDMPDHRSLHETPTPRGGGIGILAAAGAAFLWLAFVPVPGGSALAILALTVLMGALGTADDLFGLSSRTKFALMAASVLILAWFIGVPGYLAVTETLYLALPVWGAVAGAGLFIFVTVNAVNFMDGSDGMLVAGLLPGGVGLVLAGLATGHLDASFAGAALAGGLAGFLILNRPPAKVFAGDGGSLSAGALYAGGALAMAGSGFSGALWLAPLFILPFLADVLLTMARRAAGGRLDMQAHREHLYQRLVAAGWSHGHVAIIYAGVSALCVLAGLLALQGPQGAPFIVFGVTTAGLSALYLVGGRYAERLAGSAQ